MPSALDHLRAHVEVPPRQVVVVGFDPDIRILGWALVSASVSKTRSTVVHYASLHTLACSTTRDPVARLSEIVRDLARHLAVTAHTATHVVIESQQVYGKPEDSVAKVVALANDLLRVAHISGAAEAVLSDHALAKVVLPSTWKGQRDKEVDHKRSFAIMRQHRAPLLVDGRDVLARAEELPAKVEHALDGLGMALYGVDLLASGRWDATPGEAHG